MKRIFLLTVMGCYLAFAYLLYHRWLVAEAIHGGAVHFEDLLGNGNGSVCAPVAVVKPVAAIVRDAPGGAPSVAAASCRELHQISWLSVMLPLWIADALTLSAHSALLIVQHTWRPAATSFNARLEHASGACRAVLYALFKVLLLEELTNPGSPTALSWWLIFAPIYSAAVLQAIFHSFKTLEGGEALFRGRDSSRPRRRPGFALTLDDTLAFNISLHLSGVFYVHNATWSMVLWPLWLVAAVCGVGLFLLICFGVPMLSRRYPTRQFLMVLPPLVLLLATYSLSMHALMRCIEWLDYRAAAVRSTEVMSPAIAAAWCLWLLLAVVTLSALWHVPVPPNGDDDEPREPPSYESLSAQLPALLVRESSTLFRQVSARTLHAYEARYGRMDDDDEATKDDKERDGDGDLEEGSTAPATYPQEQTDLRADAQAAAGESHQSSASVGLSGGVSLSPSVGGARVGGLTPIAPSTPTSGSAVVGGSAGGFEMDEMSTPNSRAELADDGLSCWICLRDDVPLDAVLLHCGHGGLCLGCAANIWKRRTPCPMCRAPVALVARVGDTVTVDGKLVVSPSLPPRPDPQ